MAASDSDGGRTLGTTLTSGIQDIAALLPLLGTEQCEEHSGSGLTDGFLYAAATPLSIFGSLGLARAGFKTLIASVSIPSWNFNGAQKLAHAGFRPVGKNLALIMLDEDAPPAYLAETRARLLFRELHIQDLSKISVLPRSSKWNLLMASFAAGFSILSFVPYFYINIRYQNNLPRLIRWALPLVRSFGGFLTVTMIQLIIQVRLQAILQQRLSLDYAKARALYPVTRAKPFPLEKDFQDLMSRVTQQLTYASSPKPAGGAAAVPDASKLEEGRNPGEIRDGCGNTGPCNDFQELEIRHSKVILMSRFTWLLQIPLFLGIVGLVVGYVGCFTVVQNTLSSTGALIWLCLEAGLSLFRIFLWGLNPDCDDAPPLLLRLALSEHPPLPTCDRFAEDLERDMALPLVGAEEFLSMIASYAGQLERFSDPRFALYYTLTRKSKTICHRVLFITILVLHDRTARVYRQDGECRDFFSVESLTIDHEHGILETRLGSKVTSRDNAVAIYDEVEEELRTHYNSILDQLRYRLGDQPGCGDIAKSEILRNQWTLKRDDTSSERLVPSNDAEKNAKIDRISSVKDKENVEEFLADPGALPDDMGYLIQSAEWRKREEKVRKLYKARGDWMGTYMAWVIARRDEYLKSFGNEDLRFLEEIMNSLLDGERRVMEQALAAEVGEWEVKLLQSYREMSHILLTGEKGPGFTERLEKSLEKDWRTNAWKRLNGEKQCMEGRLKGVESVIDDVRNPWEHVIALFTGKGILFGRADPPESSSLELNPQEREARTREYHQTKHLRAQLQERISTRTPDFQNRCMAKYRELKDRLKAEAVEMAERLKRDLESCNEFGFTTDLLNLAYCSKKGLTIRIQSIDGCGIDAVLRAIRRNPHLKAIVNVEFYWLPGDRNLGFMDEFLLVTREMVSLTSLYSWVSEGAFTKSVDALCNAIRHRPSIVSVSGHLSSMVSERIERLLEHNRRKLEEEHTTSISFECFSVRDDGFHGRDACIVTLRFFGPSDRDLELCLTHRTEQDNVFLTCTNCPTIKQPIPKGIRFVTEGICLKRGEHFKSNSYNTLVLTTPPEALLVPGYVLQDWLFET